MDFSYRFVMKVRVEPNIDLVGDIFVVFNLLG